MKSLKFKNCFYLMLFLSLTFMLGCKNANISPEDSVVGTYQFINNPILCSFPTMSNVKIKDSGLYYILTCTLNNASSEKISNIITKKTDGTTKLFYKGTEIGTFAFLKYTEFKKESFETNEGMVLMMRFDIDNKHYEFMGRK